MCGYEHKIIVNNMTPYMIKSYPIKPTIVDKVKEGIDRMLKLIIIDVSNSPYINPIVVVIKKDGSIRLCLDARKLNERTLPEYDSPPDIRDILNQCHGTKYISTFDLRSSFWQIPLEPGSRPFTAFQFLGLTYHFNVVPFGLKNSLAALERALNIVIPQRQHQI